MDAREIRAASRAMERLSDLQLNKIVDPRGKHGRKWTLTALLTTVISTMMCGVQSLRQAEAMSRDVAQATRRALGIRGRVPDTTLRDALCKIDIAQLIKCIHRQIHAAFRRKALPVIGLPFHVVAMDGKATALPAWDELYTQKKTHENMETPYGLMRTVTCTLTSAAAKPCVHVSPIPSHSNEVGHFATAFEELNTAFGRYFQLITYDAGGASEANAALVTECGKDYVFRLRDERRLQAHLVHELLNDEPYVAETEDVLSNTKTVIRRLKIAGAPRSWTTAARFWSSAKTYLQVTTIYRNVDGTENQHEVRDFISSLEMTTLTPQQWLHVIRSHWAVENECHHTFDHFFNEDKKPWIKYDLNGMLVVLLLRRMAYNLMAMFRRVTLRSDDRRTTPWRDLMQWFRNVMIVGMVILDDNDATDAAFV